ncbi:glycosyltransferase family 2 protein [Pararobbsia alpina]|uniref:glycosyltransferase family 2 protein n=1 Tax=Pararobbsia alpina TaxID=621374 RepID=UPI001FE746A9|nr:glycosyltransferase [Pararobbsia alpina]
MVVLTYNRSAEVRATVASLLALPDRPRIIVVDNASSDNTVGMLSAAFSTIEIVCSPANIGAAGRNLGVALVATDYVAFCDDDTHWEAGSLSAAADLLDRYPAIGALNARIVVHPSGETDPTCERMRTSPLPSEGLPGPPLIGFIACACVFRTAVFRSAGGYEPRLFIGGEETLLALDTLSRGYSIVYAHDLVLHHAPSPHRDSALRRRMLARNRALVAWLRLPLAQATGATLAALKTFRRERTGWQDTRKLLALIVWALVNRRLVSPRIRAMCRDVEAAEREAAN